MGFGSIVLIAVGLAMDAFAVSVASGMVIGKIRWRHGLTFGLYFGVFQFIMPVVGWFLGSYFTVYIQAVSHWVAFGLLAVIGGRMLWEARGGSDEKDSEQSEQQLLSTGNMVLLAVATSIDALAVGVSFAVLDTQIWSAAVIIGVVAFAFSLGGIFLGKRLGSMLGKKVEILGGLILVGIGIKILVEGLMG